MNSTRKRDRFYYTTVISTYLVVAIIYIIWSHLADQEALRTDNDARLLTAAQSIKFIHTTDFHDRALSSDSVPPDEHQMNTASLFGFAREIGSPTLYTLVERQGRLYYTSSSSIRMGRDKLPQRPYFEPFPDPPEPLLEALERSQPLVFSQSKDAREYRIATVPELSPQGRRYLSCATASMDALRSSLRHQLLQTILGSIALLLVAFPMLLLHRRLFISHEKDLQSLNSQLSKDILERSKIEKELAHERYLLQELMENIPDNIYFKDAESRFIRINSTLAAKCGLSDPSEAIGKNDFDFFAEEHARQAFEDEQEIIKTGKPLASILEKEVWLDGRVTWVSTTKVPLRTQEGKIVGIVGISRDVTDWKQADDALKLANRRLQMIAESSAMFLAKASLRQQSQQLAKSVRETFGVDLCIIRIIEEQGLALLAADGLHSCEIQQVLPNQGGIFREIFSSQKPLCIPDVRADERTRSLAEPRPGHYSFVSYAGAPMLVGNEIVGVIGIYCENQPHEYSQTDLDHLQIVANNIAAAIINDRAFRELAQQKDLLEKEIVERERAEESLRFQSMLLDQIGDFVTATDLEGKILYVNAAEAEKTGLPREEIIGKTTEIFGEDPQVGATQREIIVRTLADGQWRGEIVNIGSDGSRAIVDCHTWLVRDSDGRPKGLCGVARDITEHRKIEEEKRHLQAQVQHAQKLESLGVLAGGIAHDFNNLLMGILGNADLALESVPATSETKQYLVSIGTATKRAAELTRQLLAYAGKGRYFVESLNLNSIVQEMARLLEVSISKKHTLRFELASSLPYIHADATQIRQVVMNLITNASEAIGDKEGVVSISTASLYCNREFFSKAYLDEDIKEGVYVVLEVTDTGCGIAKDIMDRIFDPFFTTKFTGRGLGLAATLGIVRGHHGALRVLTETGKGTTFKIYFPTTEDTPVTEITLPEPTDEWHGTGTILLVDDELTIREVAQRMLEHLGFRVLTASNGLEALMIFREKKEEIVCVLLDLTMPHMDGQETFREIKRIEDKIPVILSSGYNEQEVTSRFNEQGLAGFIEKPYRLGRLTLALRRCLEQSADRSET